MEKPKTRNVSLDSLTMERIKELKKLMPASNISEVIRRAIEIAIKKYKEEVRNGKTDL